MDKIREFWLKNKVRYVFGDCKISHSTVQVSCSAETIEYNWMADFAIFQNVPDFVLLSKLSYLLSDFDKFGIKISSRYGYSSWCTQICSILCSFLNILTFTSGKERFLTSLYVLIGYITSHLPLVYVSMVTRLQIIGIEGQVVASLLLICLWSKPEDLHTDHEYALGIGNVLYNFVTNPSWEISGV